MKARVVGHMKLKKTKRVYKPLKVSVGDAMRQAWRNRGKTV